MELRIVVLVLMMLLAAGAPAQTPTPHEYYRALYIQIRTAMGGKSDHFILVVYLTSAEDCGQYLKAMADKRLPITPQSVKITAFCAAARNEVRARGIGGQRV